MKPLTNPLGKQGKEGKKIEKHNFGWPWYGISTLVRVDDYATKNALLSLEAKINEIINYLNTK